MTKAWILRLPEWFGQRLEELQAKNYKYAAEEQGLAERMRTIIVLARENVSQGTGGPFAAGVFEMGTGRFVGAGVNLVTSGNCSVLHAEIVALMLAQEAVGSYSLAAKGAYELTTSVEPCAMCLGALGWAGLKRVVCGAREAEARAIGFDEGDKPAGGVRVLERRGVQVVQDVLRDEARAVLTEYQEKRGLVY